MFLRLNITEYRKTNYTTALFLLKAFSYVYSSNGLFFNIFFPSFMLVTGDPNSYLCLKGHFEIGKDITDNLILIGNSAVFLSFDS